MQLGLKTPKDCKERRGTEEGTQIEDTRSEEEKAIEIEKIELSQYQASIILTPIQEAELEVAMAELAMAKTAIFDTDAETLRARSKLVELQKSFLLDQQKEQLEELEEKT